MEILEPTEEHRLERKSSIYQNSGMLAVRKGDEWVPIAFDSLDGIVCNKVYSHKAVLTLNPYIGYQFPVKECRYISDLYVQSNQTGTDLLSLPEFYGAGFFEKKYEREIVVNSATGALGEHEDVTLRVGLDYVLAKDTLEADRQMTKTSY